MSDKSYEQRAIEIVAKLRYPNLKLKTVQPLVEEFEAIAVRQTARLLEAEYLLNDL